MIRIRKPESPPSVLTGKGEELKQGLCNDYAATTDDFKSGKQKFKFDGDVYGHESVKDALIISQHDKCCFCESKVTHISYGDVEHFRPKGGVKQVDTDPMEYPGYYWLAYTWSNLFFSCQICNQRFKGNLFPLENPAERARNHAEDLGRECPLFIDLAEEEPEALISFRQEIPYSINDHPRGKATITALGLDRQELNEMRRDRLELLRYVHKVVQIGSMEEQQVARAVLDKAVQDDAPYAAMARAAVCMDFGIV